MLTYHQVWRVARGVTNVTLDAITEQLNPANYGLALASHRDRNFTAYRFDDSAGRDTCAYIIDSGITLGPEFMDHTTNKTRGFLVANFRDSGSADERGHGSHVAGIFGSNTYGAAKNARVYMIKAFDLQGSGTNSTSLLQAFAYILSHHEAERRVNCTKGIVVNLSFGFANPLSGLRTDPALYDVVSVMTELLLSAGLPVFAAAGNNGGDAITHAPGNVPGACAIGNTNRTDGIFTGEDGSGSDISGASNYGATVKLFAPGTQIISTFPRNVQTPTDTFFSVTVFSNFSVSDWQARYDCSVTYDGRLQ
jgi:subtilisin family serine protease